MSGATGAFRALTGWVNPYITTTDRMYLLRKPSAGGPPPTCFVQREAWKLEERNSSNSDVSFEQNVITWGAMGRFEFGYGDWRASAIHVFT